MKSKSSYQNKKSLIGALLLGSANLFAAPIFNVSVDTSTSAVEVDSAVTVTYTVTNVSGTDLTISSVVPKLANSTTATARVTSSNCVNQTLASDETCTESVLLTGVSEGSNALNFWAYTHNGTVGSKASTDMSFMVGDYKYAYVTNTNEDLQLASKQTFEETGTVSRCKIDKITGAFTDCSDTGGTGFRVPTSVKFNPSGTRAFVLDSSLFGDDSTISLCDVDRLTGTFSGCSNENGGSFYLATSMAFTPSGTGVYVTTFDGLSLPAGYITYCSVDKNTGKVGTEDDCHGTSGEYSTTDDRVENMPLHPFGITLNASGTRAYIRGTNDDFLFRTGIKSLDAKTYLHNDLSFAVCNVDEGIFSECTALTELDGLPFNNQLQFFVKMALNPAGTRAYIPYNTDGVGIVRCDINSSTGIFDNCDTVIDAFAHPFLGINHTLDSGYISSLTFNASGTRAFVSLVYLDLGLATAMTNTGLVIACDVSPSTGEFDNCTDTGGTGFLSFLSIEVL